MNERTVVVVRVWLPDRPGALGAVASRIGAVRGDLVSIDVLERGGGRAVDELTVSLPDEGLVDLLISEIGQVDGVDVEDLRQAVGGGDDRAVRALAVASDVIGTSDVDELYKHFVAAMIELLGADWAVLIGPAGLLAIAGDDPPAPEWLSSFIAGSTGVECVADELRLMTAPDGVMHLVVSRAHPLLRSVEVLVVGELLGLMTRHRDAISESSGPVAGAIHRP